MFEIGNIQKLADRYNVDVLAKVVFGFSPDIVMSPLALPKEILHPWIDEQLNNNIVRYNSLRDVLVQLKSRPTFQDQWPDTYQQSLRKGKARILQLEKIRNQSITYTEILSMRPEVLKWWNQIEC
jgi:hypothetical protein